ncbi:hypothetical protein BJV82DRAFT_671938 [Fennellomyces sp. T-0311]|nr:hypothetical protein BJV82DRAFT_671938 [Fennellomyces sp. T-0311]
MASSSTFEVSSACDQQTAIYMATDQLLQQVIDLLQRLPDDEAYTRPSVVMPGGTIGKHIRHVYDHFHILLASNPKLSGRHDQVWTVDFDARTRDQPMEKDHREAIHCFRDMQNKFKDVQDTIPLDTPLVLKATVDASANIPRAVFHSSFDRELWYSCMHAIHHYAAIKAICIENNISVSGEFGMAPSTTQYQHQQQRAKMVGHL